MAITFGKSDTANRTVGVKVDMDEAIKILPIDDVPLQRWLPSDSTSTIKVEWMEEELAAQTAVITTSGDTDTPWTIVVPDTNVFRAGDILHRQGTTETMTYLVDSITNSTTMEVSEFGTTDGAVSGNDPVATETFEIVGQLLAEGADPVDARSEDRTAAYNYTQIGQEKVEASRTARKQARYAQSDPYDHEVQKKFRELAIRFERQLVSGVRYQSGNKRAMGGIFYYNTTNSVSGLVTNTKTLVQSLVRTCWTAGGSPKTLFVSPAVKAAITANYDASLRRSVRDETTVGFTAERIVTDFGDVDVIATRYLPPTKGVLLQREFDIKRVFDGYTHEMLSKTGDADKGQIVGEFSLEFKNPDAQGVLTLTDAT